MCLASGGDERVCVGRIPPQNVKGSLTSTAVKTVLLGAHSNNVENDI